MDPPLVTCKPCFIIFLIALKWKVIFKSLITHCVVDEKRKNNYSCNRHILYVPTCLRFMFVKHFIFCTSKFAWHSADLINVKSFSKTIIDPKKVVSVTKRKPRVLRSRKSLNGSKVGSFPAINLDLGLKCFIQFSGLVPHGGANVLETRFYVFVVWFDNCGVISGRDATSRRCNIFFSRCGRLTERACLIHHAIIAR